MMKTGILFDLDGTLLDTLQDLIDSVNVTLTALGYPVRTPEEVRQFVGNGVVRLLELALPAGSDDAAIAEAVGYFKEYYPAHSQIKTKPYEGILEALDAIRAEFPVAVVSNKPDIAVKPLCKDYFGDIYALGEREDCPRKPAPDMLLQAMKALGVETCIYVGDSDVDVITAKNAGVPCLSVLWGFRDRDCIEKTGGKHFCSNPKDLANTLCQMAENM